MKKESVLSYLYRNDLLVCPSESHNKRTYLDYSQRINGLVFTINERQRVIFVIDMGMCYCHYITAGFESQNVIFKNSSILKLLDNLYLNKIERYPLF
jgi:hypothetical protein